MSGSHRKLAAAVSGNEVDNSTDSDGGSDVRVNNFFLTQLTFWRDPTGRRYTK